jgi:hypothetical protein
MATAILFREQLALQRSSTELHQLHIFIKSLQPRCIVFGLLRASLNFFEYCVSTDIFPGGSEKQSYKLCARKL